MRRVVATTRVVSAITLMANAPMSLPTSTVPGPTGPARIRRSVPRRRSSNTLSSPVWAEKNRNRMAIEALKNVARSSWRRSAVTSTTATDGGPIPAAVAMRAFSSGGSDGRGQRLHRLDREVHADDALAEP